MVRSYDLAIVDCSNRIKEAAMSDAYPALRSPIRRSRPGPMVFGTITITGYDGELRGRVQLADGLVIAEAPDGSPLVIFDVTGSCVIDEADGGLRCTTPLGSFRSNDPAWVRWHQDGAASPPLDASAGPVRRPSSSDSSGRLPAHDRWRQSSSESSGMLRAMPPRLGLPAIRGLLSRWKPWQLAVAGVAVILTLLVVLVLLGLLAVWAFGLIRSHGGDWIKQLPIPVESAP